MEETCEGRQYVRCSNTQGFSSYFFLFWARIQNQILTGLKFDQQKKQVDRRLNADRVAEEKQKEQRIKKNRRQRNTEAEEVVCTGQDFAEDARGTVVNSFINALISYGSSDTKRSPARRAASSWKSYSRTFARGGGIYQRSKCEEAGEFRLWARREFKFWWISSPRPGISRVQFSAAERYK